MKQVRVSAVLTKRGIEYTVETRFMLFWLQQKFNERAGSNSQIIHGQAFCGYWSHNNLHTVHKAISVTYGTRAKISYRIGGSA